jgi:hypothetical protein
MAEPTPPPIDPRKARIGLAIISAVVLAAIVLFVIVDDPIGRAIMFAVASTGIVRVYLMSRSLREG